MDQDAFRALLSAPSTACSSRRLAQPPARSGGRLGLGSNSRADSGRTISGSGHDSAQKPPGSLKPRKFKSKNEDGTQKKSTDSKGVYRDRALERRQGKDGDFAEAEHLLENFQARVAAAGNQVDRDLLEQQTKYLGGDERHTILVKGLDHALLERRKAELSMSGTLDDDDLLEAAFEETQRLEPTNQLNNQTSSQARSSTQKPTHRDELLARLKSSRSTVSASVPADLAVVDKLKTAGKFKPIGSTGNQSTENKERERKERKKRKKERKLLEAAKLAETGLSTEVKMSDKKDTTLKSKPSQDTDASTVSEAQPDAPSSFLHPSLPTVAAELNPQPTPPKPAIATAVKSTPPHRAVISKAPPLPTQIHGEEDHVDIFGEVGDYKPFGDDSSDETEEEESRNPMPTANPAPVASSTVAFKRKNYFEDDPDPSDGTVSPKIAAESTPMLAPGLAANRTRKITELSEPEDGEVGKQKADPSGSMMRLEGLSGSTDIKSLLAADAAQEKEEKRRAKKLKKSETVKVLTEKDKLNRDVMEMDRYLKKKNIGESIISESGS
ncbi:hypothetical protein CROQUDRAFT_85363 [Cronartium quercuum f. sp. fusiforme G11]|uniref:RED-like N-terminal domain-containing protein n=1 Tax=Cronartium quercuum f. sp. fusiforme G11 TaxID=708437 RepID=A0A9P6TH02_9BASI|nr:hypothetical protein CROQUDRAFT_85363 [Cronartium quercuum f. sp. fusiforme G11]